MGRIRCFELAAASLFTQESTSCPFYSEALHIMDMCTACGSPLPPQCTGGWVGGNLGMLVCRLSPSVFSLFSVHRFRVFSIWSAPPSASSTGSWVGLSAVVVCVGACELCSPPSFVIYTRPLPQAAHNTVRRRY